VGHQKNPPLEFIFFDHQDTLQNDYLGNWVSEKTSTRIPGPVRCYNPHLPARYPNRAGGVGLKGFRGSLRSLPFPNAFLGCPGVLAVVEENGLEEILVGICRLLG